MKAYGRIQSFHKGDIVTVKALVTNLSWKEGALEKLEFKGWFGPHPIFSRVRDNATIPWVAFEAYHIEIVED
ncbi:hypothetical protein QDW23_gp47 [Microbacterium phage Stromboli]|uniref:hypothetical protein n=1 Tax=Microbacterium Phage DirtyBubble TaxID=2590932 RepID=UPI00118D5A0F|nr:hypothetical protein QDW22_gp46 [Microbacterium Phage DirtyBubble]YP_010752711.1 hypothetical protein QDW23_gp47 [Microbacterium phage Stromboli]QDP45064.1 hypothetical protein DIRTYBUBBLE_46 [Microbacterium Phage DirtyBubble]QIN93706.1 hypothetical protein SEA_STROMBOLI_47 [Microbacterium phage Stromboli]QTF81981.1 hypothetical protein SEA_BABYYODA_47 [Microbacterium phage BabyYoda]